MTSANLHFAHAIVRLPSRSVVEGLRAVDTGAPSHEGVVAEHRAYVAALERAGASVEVLPALEAFPDSIFVEDTALVFPEAAILLRPGAPTRAAETPEIAPVLRRRFRHVLELRDGFADGGDILTTPSGVFIGCSARTTPDGARALSNLLAEVGRRSFVVETPPGVLHLKSDCTLVDGETILATRRLAASGVFKGFRVLTVPEEEEAAANALRINAHLFVADGFPRTAELLAREAVTLVPLQVREVGKIDAGLSCMSLRW
jgi:dimethylargininase